MDERRQSIIDLKKRLETYVRSLDAARETLGAGALSDGRAESALAEDLNEGKRLVLDLAEARAEVNAVAQDIERLKELRLAERDGKKNLEAMRKELFEFQARLGEAALGSQEAPVAFAPFRARIDALAARVEEQEARIAELETAEDNGGLIAHLGRNARAAFLRSSQAGRRAEGRRILGEAGAALGGEAGSSVDEAIRSAGEALAAHGTAVEREEANLASIRAELKELNVRLQNVAGNPRRAIQRLEKAVEEGAENLATLHREVGARLLAAAESEGSSARRDDPLAAFAVAYLSGEAAQEARSKALSSAAAIVSAQRQIRKLEASLRIDALSAEVAKLRVAVADHEHRIASSKRALEDLGLRITEAEREIASLEDMRG